MKHGGPYAWKKGCRCDECRAWKQLKNERTRLVNQQRIANDDPTLPHGKRWVYLAGCRCEPCLVAGRAAARRIVDNVGARAALDPDTVSHGTTYTYKGGCRCDECRAAIKRVNQRHRDQAQAESLGRAENYGKEWTGAELDVVSRMPARQAAMVLGRSYEGVRKAKAKTLHDPKFRFLLLGEEAPTRNAVLPPTTLEIQ